VLGSGAEAGVGCGRGENWMIRLKHLSGACRGGTAELAKPVLRIGRAPDCDVRFDQVKDPKVSNHHAELCSKRATGSWWIPPPRRHADRRPAHHQAPAGLRRQAADRQRRPDAADPF